VPDGYVEIDQDTDRNRYGQSRIRAVVDATTLELYHGLDGFTASAPARVVQVDGANRVEVSDVRQFGGRWHLVVTPFGFFGPSATPAAFDENPGLLTADSLTGPYAWDHLATPLAAQGAWRDERSNENLTFMHTPVAGAPTPLAAGVLLRDTFTDGAGALL